MSGGASGLDNQRKSIADNFDTFLQLLITQLKNQNPLEPLDTNQFTQQLVQFTSVEQQLKTNEYLEAMLQANQSNGQAQAVGYIGKLVTTSGVQTQLHDGEAVWAYSIGQAAPNSTVTIKDEAGNVVYTNQVGLNAGTDFIVWDGTTSDGNKVSRGKFSITIDARDASGGLVPVTTELRGHVDGVDTSGAEPILILGDIRIPLSSVTSVRERQQAAE